MYSNSRLWPRGGGTNIWRKDALLFSSTTSARFWCHLFLFWSLPFLLVVYSMSFPLLLLSFNCHCSCNLFLFWCLTLRCRHCFLLLRYLQSQDLNEALKGCIYTLQMFSQGSQHLRQALHTILHHFAMRLGYKTIVNLIA